MSDRLRPHTVHLRDGPLHLRPMTEDDWDVLYAWNNDPELLYYSDGPGVTSRCLGDVQGIYRGVSQHAYKFIAELDDRPIGECWLQEMNLKRVLVRYPDRLDLRRIDLVIGRKDLWGHGWGKRMIALVVRFGFEGCSADAIFGCDVADYNPRSRRAFEKNGFVVDEVNPREDNCERERYDMILTREQHEQIRAGAHQD